MLENLGRFCRDCLCSFVGRFMANGTKKRGFTLAETLIAIAIIGILAVLVLPAITTRAQNRGFEISYNAQVKSLLNALESLPIAENRSSLTDTMMYTNDSNPSDFSDTSGAFIKKYMKVSKYCGNTPSGCFADQYTEIKNHDRLTYSTNSIKGACAILKNGVSICIKPQTKPTANEKTYVTGYLDLNGPKGPNVYGRDLRSFMVDVGEAKVYNAENPESVVTLLDIDPDGPSTCEGGICDPCVVDPDSCNNECTKPDAPANFECCKAKYHPNISGPSDACCAYRVDEKCNKCQDPSYKADHPDECGGSCTGHTITGPNDACCTAEMKAIEPKCCSDSDNSDFCCSANAFTFGCCQKSAANGDIMNSGHKCCQVFKNNGGEDGAFYKKYCTDACTEDRNSEFCCKTPQRQEQMSNPTKKSNGTVTFDGCCSTNSGKDNKKCCNWSYGSDVKSNSVAKACCNLGGTYIQKQPGCCSDDSVFFMNRTTCCTYSNDRKNSSGCCQYRTGAPAAPSGNTYDVCCNPPMDGSYTIGNQTGYSVNCCKPDSTSQYCCANAFDKLNDAAKQACCSANSNYPGCACKSEGINFKGQNDVACCNPNSVNTDYCCDALKIMNKSDEEVCTTNFIYCSKFKNSVKNGECTCVNNKKDVSNEKCCSINKNNVDKETWKSSCCSIAAFDPYRGGTATECCSVEKTLSNPNKTCCDYLYSSASGTVKEDLKTKCCSLEGWNVSECKQTPDPVLPDPNLVCPIGLKKVPYSIECGLTKVSSLNELSANANGNNKIHDLTNMVCRFADDIMPTANAAGNLSGEPVEPKPWGEDPDYPGNVYCKVRVGDAENRVTSYDLGSLDIYWQMPCSGGDKVRTVDLKKSANSGVNTYIFLFNANSENGDISSRISQILDSIQLPAYANSISCQPHFKYICINNDNDGQKCSEMPLGELSGFTCAQVNNNPEPPSVPSDFCWDMQEESSTDEITVDFEFEENGNYDGKVIKAKAYYRNYQCYDGKLTSVGMHGQDSSDPGHFDLQEWQIPTNNLTYHTSFREPGHSQLGSCTSSIPSYDLECAIYVNGNLISKECNACANDTWDDTCSMKLNNGQLKRGANNFEDTNIDECCVSLAGNSDANAYCCTKNSSDEGCCSYMRSKKGDAWIKQNAPQCNPNPCLSGNMAQCCQDEKDDLNYFDSEDQWAQTCCLQKDASGNNYAIGVDSRCCSYYLDSNSKNYYYTPNKDKGYGVNEPPSEDNICGGDCSTQYAKFDVKCEFYKDPTGDTGYGCRFSNMSTNDSDFLKSIASHTEIMATLSGIDQYGSQDSFQMWYAYDDVLDGVADQVYYQSDAPFGNAKFSGCKVVYTGNPGGSPVIVAQSDSTESCELKNVSVTGGCGTSVVKPIEDVCGETPPAYGSPASECCDYWARKYTYTNSRVAEKCCQYSSYRGIRPNDCEKDYKLMLFVVTVKLASSDSWTIRSYTLNNTDNKSFTVNIPVDVRSNLYPNIEKVVTVSNDDFQTFDCGGHTCAFPDYEEIDISEWDYHTPGGWETSLNMGTDYLVIWGPGGGGSGLSLESNELHLFYPNYSSGWLAGRTEVVRLAYILDMNPSYGIIGSCPNYLLTQNDSGTDYTNKLIINNRARCISGTLTPSYPGSKSWNFTFRN